MHHPAERDATGNPFAGRFGEVSHGRHVAGRAFAEQKRGGEAERVGIVGVKIRGGGAAALVAEEMALDTHFDAFVLELKLAH